MMTWMLGTSSAGFAKGLGDRAVCAVTAIFGTDLNSGRLVYEHLIQTQFGAASVHENQKVCQLL